MHPHGPYSHVPSLSSRVGRLAARGSLSRPAIQRLGSVPDQARCSDQTPTSGPSDVDLGTLAAAVA